MTKTSLELHPEKCKDCSERSSKELALLDEICRLLLPEKELRTALAEITHLLKDSYDFSHCLITILNRRTGAIVIKEGAGILPSMKMKGVYLMGEGITGQVVESGKPVIVPRVDEEPRFLNRTGALAKEASAEVSFICIPISTGNHILGTLGAYLESADSDGLESTSRVLQIAASMISQSVLHVQAVDEENQVLLEENERLNRLLKQRFKPTNIVGNSQAIQKIFNVVEKVSTTNATCLLLGESGTGKEVFAKTIHFNSQRADKPFVKLNCAALPESIVESELFGHEKGAFTGAHETRKGRFEAADRGTIFLDEIGELSPGVQTKLLRVLQEKEFERVGGTTTLKTDVRVIAATNQDLEERIKEGLFREDLYYRLNVIPIIIPPLRERKSDIILLIDHFLHKYNQENGLSVKNISSPAMEKFMNYNWPGNVRELENAIERAVILSEDDTIQSYHLPALLNTEQRGAKNPGVFLLEGGGGSLPDKLMQVEFQYLDNALRTARGKISEASRILGLTQRQLGLRIKRHGIDYRDYRVHKP